MGFFSKIKQGLGIGTMDAKLNVPQQVAAASGQFQGEFILTAKNDQLVQEVDITLEMVRRWEVSRSHRDSNGHIHHTTEHKSETYGLGSTTEQVPFEVKAGEVKTIAFSIPFQPFNPQDVLKAPEQSGVSKVLGVIADMASGRRNERVTYQVRGKVDLKGVALDPNDVKELFFL